MVSRDATFNAFTSSVCSVCSTAEEVEFNATFAISRSVFILLRYIKTPDTTMSAITEIRNRRETCVTRSFCSVCSWSCFFPAFAALGLPFFIFFIYRPPVK